MKKQIISVLLMTSLMLSVVSLSSCKKDDVTLRASSQSPSVSDDTSSADESTEIPVYSQPDLLNSSPSVSSDQTGSTAKPSSALSGAVSQTPSPKPVKDPYANIPAKLKNSTVKVLLWSQLSAEDKKAMEDFTQKTGIKVKPFYSGTVDMYTTRLSSMVASSDSPDVNVMFSFTYPTLITKNLVQTIENGKFDLSDPAWDKDQMDTFKWNGKYYGVNIKGNWHCDPYVVYFNKTMFRSAGYKTPYDLWKAGNWNWDTFLDCAKKTTKTVNGKNIYGYTSAKLYQFMLAENTDFVKYDNGKITNNMDDPRVLSSWQFLADLIHKHKVDPGWKDYSFFSSGQCAMYGEIAFGLRKNSFFDDMTDDWGAVPFPGPKGKKYVLPADQKVYSLSKGAKNPEGAAYFLRYWLDPQNLNMKASFIKPEFEELFNYLANQPKATMLSRGVVDYSNNFNHLTNTLYQLPSTQTKSGLDKWKGTVEGCIKQVLNEMPN